jgi:Tol biopolymer transport system component
MLQLYLISVDGQVEVQLTNNLKHVNWCPYFHPSGNYLIWSGADYTTGRGTFHLFTMELDWSGEKPRAGAVTQITDHEKMDVLPVFSPDGKQLMWTSTRAADGSSQLFLADWTR